MGPVVLNILTTDPDDRTERTCSKFTYDTKMGGAVHTQEGTATPQRDTDRLKACAVENCARFNKGKGEFLLLGHSNQKQ